mmetsp:Transcript_67327/g.186573  ORF Transcript_67327/g.186573 Transcript_67327/m.186573 type:complete len:245 (-) Transcript_67327:100-834(-)
MPETYSWTSCGSPRLSSAPARGVGARATAAATAALLPLCSVTAAGHPPESSTLAPGTAVALGANVPAWAAGSPGGGGGGGAPSCVRPVPPPPGRSSASLARCSGPSASAPAPALLLGRPAGGGGAAGAAACRPSVMLARPSPLPSFPTWAAADAPSCCGKGSVDATAGATAGAAAPSFARDFCEAAAARLPRMLVTSPNGPPLAVVCRSREALRFSALGRAPSLGAGRTDRCGGAALDAAPPAG